MTSSSDAHPLYDVVISGAGPTGLTLANLLGKAGLKVLVLERNASTVPEPRAVSIDDESLRTMQSIDLLEEVMSRVVPGYGLRYLTPSRQTFLTVSPAAKPYGHPRRNAFRQPIFESQLREALTRYPNVEARFATELTHFEQDAQIVRIEVAGGDGSRQVNARYLVGCDGASSLVRKKLGYVLEGNTPPDRWIVVDLENSPAEPHTMVFCDPRRPTIALPGPNETRRFEFKLFPGEQDADVLADGPLGEMLAQHGAAPQSRIVRKTVYSFHARVASRWSDGRVFIAGDAAHLTPPFAGQGMNSGLRDAHNLAWKLVSALRGELPAHILDSYETERRDHVSQMIQLAIDTGKIMSPRSLASAFVVQNLLRLAGLVRFLRAYFGEMKYKPKPKFRAGFIIPSSDSLIGCLLPQPMAGHTRQARDTLLDELLSPGFALLGVGLTTTQLSDATQDPIWSALGVTRVAIDPPPTSDKTTGAIYTGEALSSVHGRVLVVRPDRYVMASFSVGEENSIARAIKRLLAHGSDTLHAKKSDDILETVHGAASAM